MTAKKAAVGGGGGGAGGLLVVWLLGRFHVALGAEEGALIAAGAIAFGAAVMHDGLVGIARTILYGRRS